MTGVRNDASLRGKIRATARSSGLRPQEVLQMYLFKRIEPIREDDEYANWRAHIKVRYVRMNAPIKIDIATGDSITPAQVEYPYPMMFDDGTIRAMSSVWATYTRSAPYASSIPFDDVVDAVLELGEAVFHR